MRWLAVDTLVALSPKAGRLTCLQGIAPDDRSQKIQGGYRWLAALLWLAMTHVACGEKPRNPIFEFGHRRRRDLQFVINTSSAQQTFLSYPRRCRLHTHQNLHSSPLYSKCQPSPSHPEDWTASESRSRRRPSTSPLIMTTKWSPNPSKRATLGRR